MNAFEHRLWNAKSKVAPFVARSSVSNYKHTRLILEKLANLISAQIPHLSDFRNGVMPLDVH
jgi:hypothetical protein